MISFLIKCPPKENPLLRVLVPKIVDTTLHHLLWMLEQEESLELMVNDEIKKEIINEISDGLSGELYTEDGSIVLVIRETKNGPITEKAFTLFQESARLSNNE